MRYIANARHEAKFLGTLAARERYIRAMQDRTGDCDRLGFWDGMKGFPRHSRWRFTSPGHHRAYLRGYRDGAAYRKAA